MPVTNSFFDWFFYGLGGLGGWIIFLLLALAAMAWTIYDSARRRLPALGWRMGVVLTALLILPAMLFRFTATDLASMPDSPLAPFREVTFYLGLLGGIVPGVLAIGYYVSFKGLVGCPAGHLYEDNLPQCPHPDHLPPPSPPSPPAPSYPTEGGDTMDLQRTIDDEGAPELPAEPPKPPKRMAQAWLVAASGESYQLCEGVTAIGRSAQNDIVLNGDITIGRQHAKIVEYNGRYRLTDLGSKNFTRVNGHILRETELLRADDEIQFGDDTILHFVTSRK